MFHIYIDKVLAEWELSGVPDFYSNFFLKLNELRLLLHGAFNRF